MLFVKFTKGKDSHTTKPLVFSFSSLVVLVFLFRFFVWKVDRGREKREIFRLLVCSSDCHSDLGWTKPKPGAWNSIWVSTMAAQVSTCESSSAAFSKTLSGSWIWTSDTGFLVTSSSLIQMGSTGRTGAVLLNDVIDILYCHYNNYIGLPSSKSPGIYEESCV